MPKELIDDELWSLIEPFLPARAPRNRQYAGRKPTLNRAVLTGIVFVLRPDIACTNVAHAGARKNWLAPWQRTRQNALASRALDCLASLVSMSEDSL